ncbi:MAG: hypothetical protein ACMXYG_07805 [Candidatus Woesearchaeota archaeon]
MAYEKKCIICDEAITNPICPYCLEKQVMYWISERKASLIPLLKKVGESVKEFSHENTFCAVCNNDMNVCPHCYCNEIYTWLIENNYKELAEEFLESFNFELDYKFDLKTPNQII